MLSTTVCFRACFTFITGSDRPNTHTFGPSICHIIHMTSGVFPVLCWWLRHPISSLDQVIVECDEFVRAIRHVNFAQQLAMTNERAVDCDARVAGCPGLNLGIYPTAPNEIGHLQAHAHLNRASGTVGYFRSLVFSQFREGF